MWDTLKKRNTLLFAALSHNAKTKNCEIVERFRAERFCEPLWSYCALIKQNGRFDFKYGKALALEQVKPVGQA